jgi:hypothetical protein
MGGMRVTMSDYYSGKLRVLKAAFFVACFCELPIKNVLAVPNEDFPTNWQSSATIRPNRTHNKRIYAHQAAPSVRKIEERNKLGNHRLP